MIGHFNFIRSPDVIRLAESATIASFNWICGPSTNLPIYPHAPQRKCFLELGAHSAITSQHYIDTSYGISIGKFSTIAGVRSALITHSIDLENSYQTGAPIVISDYCFLGSNVVVLGGVVIADKCVVGAGSTVIGGDYDEYGLYCGNPAVRKKNLDPQNKYFTRENGYVE